MIEYGMLASKSSEMFSGIMFQLKESFYQHPYILLAMGGCAVAFYLFVWK